MPPLSAAAQKIVSSRPQTQYLPEDNLLFQALYNAYCKLERPDDSFGKVVSAAKAAGTGSSDKYIAARRALVRWYAGRYRPRDKKEKTNQGIERGVFRRNIEEGVYRFDEPVDPQLFEVYLNDFPLRQHPFQTSDARSFILHTAVAFLLPPEQLDQLLVAFGFHPLHARHIHDMAVYVVLRDAGQSWTPEERRERNPFEEVWELYEAARLLLIRTQAAQPRELSEAEQSAFRSDSTRVVQRYILAQRLSKESLLAYVGSHTEFYHLRYRRLLAEHKRLADLFSALYIQRWSWEEDDRQYSLYAFLSSNCRSFNKKDFNRRIYGEIAKFQKHPKRELMVILWLYAYSFLFCPEVSAPCNCSEVVPFRNIKRELGLPLEYPFSNYFDKKAGRLRVLEYLSDPGDRASPLSGFYDGTTVSRIFRGSELVAFLNRKLADYTWRQLDARNAFDRNILALSPLKVTMDEDGGIRSADYGGEMIDGARQMSVDNVPGPLAMFFHLFREIKAVDNRSVTGPDNIRMPLPCDCFYELI